MSLNSVLLLCAVLLVITWLLMTFRKAFINKLAQAPLLLKIAAFILVLALFLLALAPIIILILN